MKINHHASLISAHALEHSSVSVRRWNIALIVAGLGLLMYYVIQVNLFAAQNWSMQNAKDRLSALHDQRNTLVAQESSFDDRQKLLALAEQQGMVPAGAVTYVVQDHAVAAR